MKVRNRSTSIVSYSVPDLKVKREFSAGEIKEIPQEELAILIQQPGGKVILTEYLQVNKEDIKSLDIEEQEQEYFYNEEDVKRIMKFGTLDEFLDMLDFAPEGVMDMIKTYAIELPLSDLYKVNALKDKTGFDSTKALENSIDENGELRVADTPKRRVSNGKASVEKQRRIPEYKVITDN